MSGRSISLGLGARNLRDRDFFGVSDPYVVISRPNPSGGFTQIRTSETKKNTLNPNWNDFLFTESELNGYDKELKLMIQIYDDDGKKGPDTKDQLIGSGFFNLKELEAASLVNTNLPLTDGKRSKSPGSLVIRSYKEHQGGGGGSQYGAPSQVPTGVGYPPQPRAGAGYPQTGGYGGAPSQGYPGQGFPSQGFPGQGYPTGGPGYPGGAPPNQGYGAGQGYPGGAPPNQGYGGGQGYPGGAPPNQGYGGGQGYPGGAPPYQGYGGGQGYPGQNPPANQGYGGGAPYNDPMFPPNNLPSGPGGFYNPN